MDTKDPTKAVSTLAKALAVDVDALREALKQHDIDVDFNKVVASGYKGERVQVYPEQTVPCSCCKKPVVRGEGEYSNSPPCKRCGATDGLCYYCDGCEE